MTDIGVLVVDVALNSVTSVRHNGRHVDARRGRKIVSTIVLSRWLKDISHKLCRKPYVHLSLLFNQGQSFNLGQLFNLCQLFNLSELHTFRQHYGELQMPPPSSPRRPPNLSQLFNEDHSFHQPHTFLQNYGEPQMPPPFSLSQLFTEAHSSHQPHTFRQHYGELQMPPPSNPRIGTGKRGVHILRKPYSQTRAHKI